MVLGSLDVLAEILSTYYIISTKGSFGIGAVLTTTVFYVFQALIPYVFICYICTLRENHTVSWKCLALCGVPTLILLGIILTNPFTGLLFSFDAYRGYVKGSWYMLMYASALFHILAAFIMVLAWKKKLDRQKIRTLREIVVLDRRRRTDTEPVPVASNDRLWPEPGDSDPVLYHQQSLHQLGQYDRTL